MKKSDRIIRLLKLLEMLEKHTAAESKGLACQLNGVSRTWDMNVWDCGTAACALGSAALTPWFKARGLRIKVRKKNVIFGLRDVAMPVYREEQEYKAGALFFGITYDESLNLFYPDGYQNDMRKLNTEVNGYQSRIPVALVRARVLKLLLKYAA